MDESWFLYDMKDSFIEKEYLLESYNSRYYLAPSHKVHVRINWKNRKFQINTPYFFHACMTQMIVHMLWKEILETNQPNLQ